MKKFWDSKEHWLGLELKPEWDEKGNLITAHKAKPIITLITFVSLLLGYISLINYLFKIDLLNNILFGWMDLVKFSKIDLSIYFIIFYLICMFGAIVHFFSICLQSYNTRNR